MGSWNIGSISTEIFNLVDDIPTAMSGNTMNNIIEQKMSFMEQELGVTIGTTSVALKYQGPWLHLSVSSVQNYIQALGAEAESIRLGEFSISKGMRKDNSAGEIFEQMGLKELEALKSGRSKYSFYKSY